MFFCCQLIDVVNHKGESGLSHCCEQLCIINETTNALFCVSTMCSSHKQERDVFVCVQPEDFFLIQMLDC